MCLGFFLFETGWYVAHPRSKTLTLWVHHIGALFFLSTPLYYGHSGAECCGGVFVTENTIPALMLRWFMRDAGCRPLYVILVDYIFLTTYFYYRAIVGTVPQAVCPIDSAAVKGITAQQVMYVRPGEWYRRPSMCFVVDLHVTTAVLIHVLGGHLLVDDTLASWSDILRRRYWYIHLLDGHLLVNDTLTLASWADIHVTTAIHQLGGQHTRTTVYTASYRKPYVLLIPPPWKVSPPSK